MTIKYIAFSFDGDVPDNWRYAIGLSSDPKPKDAPDTSIFYEQDTGKTFYIQAGVWSETLNPAYAVKIAV